MGNIIKYIPNNVAAAAGTEAITTGIPSDVMPSATGRWAVFGMISASSLQHTSGIHERRGHFCSSALKVTS